MTVISFQIAGQRTDARHRSRFSTNITVSLPTFHSVFQRTIHPGNGQRIKDLLIYLRFGMSIFQNASINSGSHNYTKTHPIHREFILFGPIPQFPDQITDNLHRLFRRGTARVTPLCQAPR